MNNSKLETKRLILRRFTPEDWQDLLEIARSKESSAYAYTDDTWPTDEGWAKGASEYMATDTHMWAMARKEDGKVICYINCNGMNDEKLMDIGHVMNMEYAGQGYEEEGLAVLYRNIFDTTDAVGIIAIWALEDTEKTAPLFALGMEVVEQNEADAFDGSGRKFTACILRVSKEEFLTGKKEK